MEDTLVLVMDDTVPVMEDSDNYCRFLDKSTEHCIYVRDVCVCLLFLWQVVDTHTNSSCVTKYGPICEVGVLSLMCTSFSCP